MTLDLFKTDQSSGRPSKYWGVVTDGYFGTLANYQDGEQLLLQWKVNVEETDSGEPIIIKGEVVDDLEVMYSTGTGWETTDAGKTANKEGRDNTDAGPWFHANSALGTLVGAIIEGGYEDGQTTDGNEVEVDFSGIEKFLEGRDPRHGDCFAGACFYFDEIVFDYGGKIGKVSRVFPVRFDLERSVTTGKKAPAKKAPAKAKKATGDDAKAAAKAKIEAARKAKEAKADGDDTEAQAAVANAYGEDSFSDLDEEVRGLANSLIDMASDADDFASWADAVMENEAIMASDELMALVVDETFYETAAA